MTNTAAPAAAEESQVVRVQDVEAALSRWVKSIQGSGETPALCARMSNLVIYCDRAALAQAVAAEVPAIVAVHPARVVLVIGEAESAGDELVASILVRPHMGEGRRLICSEQVTLHAKGAACGRLPFAVRGLLIGDLPTNLWWAAPEPPALAGALMFELAEHAQQIVYDSIGWLEPARGVAATASWLARVERDVGQGPWRVVSDLNWRRLKYWRRLLAQALDPASAPGAVDSITEVLIEHGPHAVVQAWEIASWLAARVGWRVQAGKVEPGVEICWQFTAPRSAVRVRIHRLAEGPPEVRRMRIACTLDCKPTAFDLVVQDSFRLAVIPEESKTAARTLATRPLPIADLVGRQLSDRERDPIFRESMTVAGVLAESVM